MPTEREVLEKVIGEADEESLAILRKAQIANPADPQPMTVCGGPDSCGIIGAMQKKCDQCSDLLWLSPSSLELIEKRGNRKTTVMCMACVVKCLKASEQ